LAKPKSRRAKRKRGGGLGEISRVFLAGAKLFQQFLSTLLLSISWKKPKFAFIAFRPISPSQYKSEISRKLHQKSYLSFIILCSPTP